MQDLIDYAEERGRRELSALGDAEGEFTDFLDDDGVTGAPVRFQIKLSLRKGMVTADFSGSNPQVAAGINSTLSTTRSVLQWCLRTQMSEDYPDNAGFYRLLNIRAAPGTIVNANNDAPVASRGLTAFRLVDCIFGAMAVMFPGRIWAAGDGSTDPLTIGGRREDGSRFTMVEPVGGTTGARPTADGIEGVAPPVGNARNSSVEVIERSFPVRILQFGIAPGTGGVGTYRGGNAITRSYELLCDKAEVVIRSDRKKHLPWGLAGGPPGSPSLSVLVTQDGKEIELPSRHVFEMLRGQRLVWRGAGGGGYGPPASRDPQLLERDRREGRMV
jgi:N-methylhydantoinase B